MRKRVLLPLLAVAALTAVVAARTLLMPSRQLVVAPAAPVAIDGPAVAARLAGAVRLKTIASPSEADPNAAEFAALQAHLQASFPRVHQSLKREVVGRHALLYTWPGSDPQAPGIGLMAHQDVVPVAAGTEGDWQRPPFSGDVTDGFVWGRGSWDDKGNLMSILEAVEMRLAAGFVPRQTIYLIFGDDEEIGGERGAKQIAQLLKSRNVRLQAVIDEGLLITEGVLKGLDRPAALVGVAEKGYLSLQLSASATPGHSSMPPPAAEQSAIGMLSAALARLESHPMPAAMKGLPEEMFETLAPEMNGVNRVLLSNLWLFKPLVARELQKAANTNAVLRTTTALTVFHAGNADNVLPGRAQATVNFRLLPGDSSDSVVEHVKSAVANPAVEVARIPGTSEASRVARTEAAGYQLISKTLRQLHPDVVVAPGLMIGATDSRHFEGLAENIYKFSPVRAGAADLKRFHGTDERISTANYAELIQFYHQLIGNASLAVATSP